MFFYCTFIFNEKQQNKYMFLSFLFLMHLGQGTASLMSETLTNAHYCPLTSETPQSLNTNSKNRGMARVWHHSEGGLVSGFFLQACVFLYASLILLHCSLDLSFKTRTPAVSHSLRLQLDANLSVTLPFPVQRQITAVPCCSAPTWPGVLDQNPDTLPLAWALWRHRAAPRESLNKARHHASVYTEHLKHRSLER